MTAVDAAALDERSKQSIIVGVLTAMLLAALDQTIVAPAMTTIGAKLGDSDYLSWVISAYLLTSTAVTPLYGKLADVHGRRQVLSAAVVIFMIGSVLCALAPSMLVLILGRAVQGLGGGGLMSLAQTVIGDIVPPRQRGRYMAQISGVWAISSITGPVLGGFFADHLHWSLIFWVNIPVGIAALFVIDGPLRRLAFVPKSHRLDIVGSVLVIAATSLAMLALTWGGHEYAWGSSMILGLFAASAALWVAFGVRVATFAEPLMPIEVLRDPVVLTATLGVFFGMAGFVGMSICVPIYFEALMGFTPGQAGLALIALMLGTVLGAGTTGRLLVHVTHYKRIVLGGIVASLLGFAGLYATVGTASVVVAEALLAVAGIGLGSMFPVAMVSVQNSVPRHHLGVATAALAFLRSLGSALGVAVLGAVALGGMGLHEGGGAPVFAAGEAVEVFRLVFLTTLVTTGLSLVCFLLMAERPLRESHHPVALAD